MTGRFTVLASGSGGNATLLEANGFGLLVDCGLGPRLLTSRLAEIGASWDKVHAVILTHTHSDHWKGLTLAHLRSRRIPIYAHPTQLDQLNASSEAFDALHKASLTRTYSDRTPLEIAPGLTCRPVPVSHDAEPTFAFRFDFSDGEAGPAWSVGYAADLGCGSAELVQTFAGVDVLALEYNHDEQMEKDSPRPAFLVQRVLSDTGHLSNRQAADLTRAIVGQSGPGFPHHVVQLHLSRDCNLPALAAAAGRAAVARFSQVTEVVTATQHVPAKSIRLSRRAESADRTKPRPTNDDTPVPTFRRHVQSSLPGFDA